jgi:hypothetical protein
VYSYGVVLLELLCRKMPVDSAFGEGVDIVTWMRSNLKQADHPTVMSCLDEEILYWPEDEQAKALDLLDLAISCTQTACQLRPSMREVVDQASSSTRRKATPLHLTRRGSSCSGQIKITGR